MTDKTTLNNAAALPIKSVKEIGTGSFSPSMKRETTAIVPWTDIVMSTGNKGGVGKSTDSRSTIEGFKEAGIEPVIIEADGGNSDVAIFYNVKDSFNLNSADGFVSLFTALETSPLDRPVVVSLPGGVDEKALEHSPAFFDALADLAKAQDRRVTMHWVLDDKRDGLEALRTFRTRYPAIPVDVIRNLFFGPPAAFKFFDESNERKLLSERGGRVVDLPALTGRIARAILIQRLTHAKAMTVLGILDRREFLAWWHRTLANYREGGLLP